MPELSIPPDVQAFLSLINQGTGYAQNINQGTGYLTPDQLQYTPQGQSWLDNLYNTYNSNYKAGTAGYGLPGLTGGDPTKLREAITQAALYGQGGGEFQDWIKSQGGMPNVPTLANTQIQMADTLARDLQTANDDTQKWLQQENAKLQTALQNGQISADQASQASQQAHQKAMQAAELAYNYAELSWTKEYGTQNLQILRDRLTLDTELGRGQLAVDERGVAVEEGRLGLDRDKFGFDKSMQEAQMRANPFNAVAYALYSRGAGLPNTGTSQYGQPMTSLDNSGQLPFLQVLNQQGGQLPMFQNSSSPLNAGGIGGNTAPNPNQISQANFGNMSNSEKGITTSLAAYQGYDPEDYWKLNQNSWNTNGQGAMNFGQTRMM